MKKFLLTIAAIAAVSAINAETVVEEFNCMEPTGATEEGAALEAPKAIFSENPDASKASEADMSTANMKAIFVSGPVAGFTNASELPLEPSYDNKFNACQNPGQKNNPWLYNAPSTEAIGFYFVQGKGNPVDLNKVVFEEIETEGEKTGVYRANWDASYYRPDGSLGLPSNGCFAKFTPAYDGELTILCWINKGNRCTYVAKASDMKAMAFGTDVKVSGWIHGQTYGEPEYKEGDELFGKNKFMEKVQTWSELHPDATEEQISNLTKEGKFPDFILGEGNQITIVYLTFDVKANETYYVFNNSAQIGLNSYKYTYEAQAEPPVVSGDVVRVLPDFTLEEGKTEGKLPAGTVLVDDANIKAVTVYEATCGINEADFTKVEASVGKLTKWFNLRVDANPDASNPNGTVTSGSTPIVFSPKADMDLTVFNRTGPGKAILMTNKADFSAVEGTVKDAVDNEKNSFYVYTYTLKANNEYVLTQKGGTSRFYGFEYKVAGGSTSVTEIVADENAPVEYYNLQGIRVNNPENGLYIRRQGNKVTKVIL